MEGSSEEKEKIIEEPLLDCSRKGGFRTIPFIIANEALLGVATTGLPPNMIFYLMREYHLDMAAGSNIIFLWTAAMNFMPLLGAVIADSFAGRFWMIGFGCMITFLVYFIPELGMIALWLTSMIPQARPQPCNEFNSNCSSATNFQLFLLCTSLGLISIGAGGIRSASLAFGADQLKQRDGDENTYVIKRYIRWYYTSWMFSIFIAFGCIVYIQDNTGWKVGFGIPAALMFLSALSFFLASSFYVKVKANSRLVTELTQVMVAAYRKRHIKLSPSANYLYHQKQGSSMVVPSEKLRFLNRACIVLNPQEELNLDGTARVPWSLCKADQVQDLKSLIRVIPLWLTGMLMTLATTQNTILTLQAKSMNRNIGSSFEIPAGSFAVFTLLSMTLWVPIYDHIVLPIASRIKGKPVSLCTKLRLGLGIFLSCLSLMVKAVVETIRRNRAISEVDLDDPKAIVNMSAMWLIPELILSGFADSLSETAQYEFFYLELPRSMASIASSLVGVGFALANILSSFIMSTINDLTRRGGNDSWISSNINRGHYDYYFWVTAGFCMVDMMIFLICSKAYGPCKGETREIEEEQDRLIE